MLRNLFIIMFALGFVFVLYSMTTQNANATQGTFSGCQRVCVVEPDCECLYGNDNHTRDTYCEDEMSNPDGDPCNANNPTQVINFSVSAACGNNETPKVTPENAWLDANQSETGSARYTETGDYCAWVCTCNAD